MTNFLMMNTKLLVAVSLAFAMQTAFSFSGMVDPDAKPSEVQAQPSDSSAQESADSKPANEEVLETIRKNAQARLGSVVKKVQPSPIKGLYEVVIGNEVIYTDETADHVIMGEMFHTLTRENLTEATRNLLLQIDFDKDLPFEDAIKTVYGDGSRKIAVFSDPNCSFCKKLETNLKDLKDVTIYTFLYPVITPTSKEASANIWCAADNSTVWRDHMVDGKAVPTRDAKCDISVLDRNISLGRKLNVTGTPVVFFENGSRTPGAASLEYIERHMQPQQQ